MDNTFRSLNDSDNRMSISSDFLDLNQSIYPMFILNNSAMVQNEFARFLKGLIVTHFVPSFYILIILISLPLNALALVTFTWKIQEKNPTVIFMSNLACADLLLALLLPLKIHYRLNSSDWVFGEAACRVVTAAYYCYMYCSILLMMCMSVDRLLAVVFPIASLTWRSGRNATFVCVIVWLLSLAGVMPLLLIRQTLYKENIGVTCLDILEFHTSLTLHLSVFLILPCIYFFLPLIIILLSYSTMIYVLCTKLSHLTSSSSSSGNRHRAVIMATAVLIEFVVCFGPSHGFLVYHFICVAMGRSGQKTYPAYLLAVCLGSASVFLDPLLYYYGSSQYRQQIGSVFRGRISKRTNTPSNATHTHTHTEHHLV